jgi:hypothetical protein
MKRFIILATVFLSIKVSGQIVPGAKSTSGYNSFQLSSAATLTLDYASEYVFNGYAAIYTLPAVSSSYTSSLNQIVVKNDGKENVIIVTSNGSSLIYNANNFVSRWVLYPGETCTFLPNGTYFSLSMRAASTRQLKENIILFVGGQSNEGTTTAMGQTDSSDMPAHLKISYDNIWRDTTINGVLYMKQYYPTSTMGWLNQMAYVLSKSYKNVFISKYAVGGTTLAPGGGAYNRSNYKLWDTTCLRIVHNMVDTATCDMINVWGQCESDALTLGSAVTYQTRLDTLVNKDVRINIRNRPWIIKRLSNFTKDFTYKANLQAGQDSFKVANSQRVILVNTDSLRHKGNDTKTGVTGNGDFSHYRGSTACIIGTSFADSVLAFFGKIKSDRVKPRLIYAATNTAGTTLTLTFTETLNEKIVPHQANFIIGTKTFSAITISGNTVVLTPTVPFYSGQSFTLTFNKYYYYKETFQDLMGNEFESIGSFPIVNNSTVAAPTLTTLYTSNFTTLGSYPADLPNWWTAPTGGTTATANTTSVTGVTACAKFDAGAGLLNRFYKWQTSFVADSTYRISFKIEMPDAFSHPGNPSSLYALCKILSGNAASQLYFTGLLMRDRMTYIEYQFTNTSPTNDDFYFEFGSSTAGTIYFKDVIIQKVTPGQ